MAGTRLELPLLLRAVVANLAVAVTYLLASGKASGNVDDVHDDTTSVFGGDRRDRILGIDHTGHIDRAVARGDLSQASRSDGEEGEVGGEHLVGLLQ